MPPVVRRLAGAAAVVFGLSGCVHVARFESLPEAQPGADLIFQKGYHSSFGVAGSTYYDLSPDPARCTDNRSAARLLWTTGDNQQVRVPGDRPIVITAASLYFYSTGGSTSGSDTCAMQARFTPQTGHQYEVKLVHSLHRTCDLKITDRATGAEMPMRTDPTAQCYRLNE
ncbi:MAG: hypothetical protein K1X35_05390 [Caulobacteraceae bacterium]|nr:hypothetical protein [Caulobacteraceae bacterium]